MTCPFSRFTIDTCWHHNGSIFDLAILYMRSKILHHVIDMCWLTSVPTCTTFSCTSQSYAVACSGIRSVTEMEFKEQHLNVVNERWVDICRGMAFTLSIHVLQLEGVAPAAFTNPLFHSGWKPNLYVISWLSPLGHES